jgi:hypothetical protein
VADQPGGGKPVDRIAIASDKQLEVEGDLTLKPCANQCWGIRLNFAGKAAIEMAMSPYRPFSIACSGAAFLWLLKDAVIP